MPLVSAFNYILGTQKVWRHHFVTVVLQTKSYLFWVLLCNWYEMQRKGFHRFFLSPFALGFNMGGNNNANDFLQMLWLTDSRSRINCCKINGQSYHRSWSQSCACLWPALWPIYGILWYPCWSCLWSGEWGKQTMSCDSTHCGILIVLGLDNYLSIWSFISVLGPETSVRNF